MALTMPMKTWEKGGSGNASTASSATNSFVISKNNPLYEASLRLEKKQAEENEKQAEEEKRKKYEADKEKAKYYSDNIDSFVKTYNDISAHTGNFFDEWKNQNESSYTQGLYTSLNDHYTKLRDSVLDNSYLKDVLSEDEYIRLERDVNAIGKSIEDTMAGIKSASDVYAQYGSADDYDKHVRLSGMSAEKQTKAEEEANNALPEFDRLAFENSLLSTQSDTVKTPVRKPSDPISPLMQNVMGGVETPIEIPNAHDDRDKLMNAQAAFGKYVEEKEQEGKTIPSVKEEDKPKATFGENALGFAQTASTNLALGAANSISSIVNGLEQAIGDAASGGAYSDGFKVLSDYFGAMPSELRTEVLAELGTEGHPNRPTRIGSVSRATGVSQNVIEQYAKSVQNENMRESVLNSGYAEKMNPALKEHTADIAFSIGQQIPGLMLSGALSGATSATSAIGSAIGANPSTVLIGMSVAGNEAFNLAREKGYNPSIYAEAVMQGGIEMILEGLIGFSDVASYQKLMTNTGSTVGNVAKSFIKYIVSGAEEGLEEVINVPLSNLTSMMFGADKKIGFGEGDVFDYKEMIKSGMSGAAVGLIMGGVMGTSMAVSAVKEGADIRYNADWLNKMAQKLPEHYRPATVNAAKATETDIENYGKELTSAFNKYMTDSMDGKAVLSNKDKYGEDVASVTEDNSTVQLADQAEVLAHVQAEDTEGAKEIIEQKIQHYNEMAEALADDESLKEISGEGTAEKIASNVARLTETKDMLDAGTYNADEAQKVISAQMQKKIAEGKKTTAAARQFAETVKSNLGVVQGERAMAHTVELLEADVKNGVANASAQLKVAKKALDSIRKEPSSAVRSLLGNTEKELGAAISDSSKKRSVQFDYSMPEGSYASYNRGTGTVKINPMSVLMAQSQMDNGNKARSEFVHEAGHIAAQMDASFVSKVYDVYTKLRADKVISENGLGGLNETDIREAYRKDKSLSNYLNTATVKNGIKQLVAQGTTVEQARESFAEAFLQEEIAMHFLSWAENNGANLYNTIVPEKRNAFVEAMRKIAQFFRDVAAKIRGKDPASAKKMDTLADKLYNAVRDFAGGSTTAQESVNAKTTENTTATESGVPEGSTGTQGADERKSLDVASAEDEDGVYFNDNGDAVAADMGDGSTRYSLVTYREGGRDTLVQYLDKRVAGEELSDADADDIIAQMDAIYDLCEKMTGDYKPFGEWSTAVVDTDEDGNPIMSVIKPNGEYVMNLDFSLVCKKRRALDAVFKELIRRGTISDFDLGQEQIVQINDIIRKHGFEIACQGCFVEAKRFRQAKVADTFVNMYNSMVKSMAGGKDIAHFNFGRDESIPSVENGIDTMNDSDLNMDRINAVLAKGDEKTVPYKIAKHLKENPSDRKLLSRGDFMSSESFENVTRENPAIMSLYNSKKGSGGPKAAFGDVQYLSDIVRSSSFNAEKAFSVGGVRVQSFSDYVARLVFDYVQMVGDLAAKALPAHAYTKEALFVKQFGLTGMKINMSLFPARGTGTSAGLNEDGSYAWADESFDYDTAIEIQNDPEYAKNCGTICVGVSDEHIRKLLADDNIRMVIPYHKSGLNPVVAKMNNIDGFKNYTNEQNTRYANGKKLSKEDLKSQPNFNDLLHSGMDAVEASRVYVEWCEDNGYLPKFDRFAYNADGTLNENYYKLLEDFTTMVDGKYYPQEAVKAVFPNENSAFGSMESLIREGLEEDAAVQFERDAAVGDIVDEIESVLGETGERKSIATGSSIYIKDGHTADGQTVDFINLILDGKKKGETRSHKSLTRKWVGIAKDGYVYGRVRFGEPYLIDKDSPEYADSYIEGTEYDIADGEQKYYYPILEVEDFRDAPKPITKNGNYAQYEYEDGEEDSEDERFALKKSDEYYDYSKSFSEQIDDYIARKLPVSDTLVVGSTPEVFKKIGLLSLPVTYDTRHLSDVIKGDKRDHKFGVENLKKIPEALKTPVAIFASNSHPNSSVVAILDLSYDGESMFAAVEIDGFGQSNGNRINSNKLSSVHTRENAIRLLKDSVEEHKFGNVSLFYIDMEKASDLLDASEVDFLGGTSMTDGFVHSIHDPGSPVNTRIKNVTYTQQFKRWFGDWRKIPEKASKVVKRDGTPRIVYHYTDGEFTVFDPSKSGDNQGKSHGDGIYVSTNPSEFSYAGKNKMELYANIRNPFEMYLTGKQADYILDKYASANHDLDGNDGMYRAHAKAKLMTASRVFDYLNQYAQENGIKTSDILKDLGFDGVHDGSEWVAFNANQLKSATDNIGLFDANNDDIRYSKETTDKRIARLKEDKEFLKQQMEKSRSVALSPADVDKIVKDMRDQFGFDNSERDNVKKMLELIDKVVNKKIRPERMDEVWDSLTRGARSILEGVYEVDASLMKENEAFIKHIRSTPLSVPEENENDFAGGYAEYRNENRKYVNLSRNGTPVETVYAAICEQYPGILDHSVTNPAYMIDEIVHAMKALEPEDVPSYADTIDQAAQEFAHVLGVKYMNTAQKTYFSDVHDEVSKLKRENRQTVTAYEARFRSIESAAARDAKEYERIINRYKNMEEAREFAGDRKEYARRIRQDARALRSAAVSPNSKKFVPEKYRGNVERIAEFLDYVSTGRVNLNSDIAEPWAGIARIREDFRSVSDMFSEDFEGLAMGILQQMEFYTSGLSQMENKDLKAAIFYRDAYKLGRLMRKSIADMNKVVINGKNVNAANVGADITETLNHRRSTQKEFESLGDKKSGKIMNVVFNKNLSFTDARSFFHRMGKAGDNIYETLRDAQSRQYLYIKQYTDAVGEKLKDIDLSQYAGDKQKTVTITLSNGKEYTLTAAQAMNIVTLYERESGKSHIENGGVRIYNPKTRQASRATALTEKDIVSLRNALDETDKKVMRVLSDFMRNECTAWGNEATMEKYGFHRFTTKDYFPISVDRTATGADMKSYAPAQFNVENVGFAKPTKDNASAPVMIDSMIDVANNHIRGMASYAAYLNVEDGINRIMKVPGVVDTMKRALGSEAEKYITEMMNDLKGAGKTEELADNTVDLLNKFAGRYKAAAVSYNTSTVAKQPLSYLRAAAVLDAKYLVKGASGNHKVAYDEMMKHSGIAVRKEIGYSDVGVGKTIGEQIGYTERGTLKSGVRKFNEFGMAGAALADRVTWESIWLACKAEQMEKNASAAIDHDKLMQATAKRFADVVAQTQVVDSALDSAPVSRSNNPLVRLTYAFMSEPIKGYNLFVDALDDLSNSPDKEAKNRAAKHLARVSAYTLLGWAAEAAITSAFSAIRDDDDEFVDKFSETYFGNLGQNALGILPVADPIVDAFLEVFQGYTPSNMADQTLIDVASGMVDAFKTIMDAEGKRETPVKAIRDAVESVATMLGVPVKNIVRMVNNTAKSAFQITNAYKASYELQKIWYNPNNATAREKNGFNSILADAYLSGDKEAFEYIYEDMRKMGLKPQQLVNSIAKDAFEGDIADKDKSTLVKYTPGSDAWYIGMKTIFNRDEKAPKATEDEITRVYKATGETSVLPKFKSGEYTVDGVSKEFTGDALDKYLDDYGRLYYEVANAMRDLAAYRKGSAEEQAWWLTKAEKYASAVAVYTQDKDYSVISVGKWVSDYVSKKPYEVAKYIVGNLEKK